jgi:hypothetical protein
MTDLNVNDETQEVSTDSQSELEVLKARATMMGLDVHHKVGVEKLRKQIENALNNKTASDTDMTTEDTDAPIVDFLSQAEFNALALRKRRKNAGSLVRVRIVCMNPNKKDWEGEIFSVGSAKLGTFKKFVPFNGSEDGYHIPQIMLDMIKERKCAVFHTVRGPKGNKIRKAKLVPEFSIEVLPPLSKDELKELAKHQAMTGSLQD